MWNVDSEEVNLRIYHIKGLQMSISSYYYRQKSFDIYIDEACQRNKDGSELHEADQLQLN